MAYSQAEEVFFNGVVPVFEENSRNSLCNVSRRKRTFGKLDSNETTVIDLTRFYPSEAREKTVGRSNAKVYN